MPIRVLELRSVWGTGGGPEKTIMLGAAHARSDRVAVTVCYLRDSRDRAFRLDAVARELGVRYVEIVERHSFDPRIWSALRRLTRERRIDVVHAHDYKTDLLAWMLAKRDGITPLATAHGWSGTSIRERLLYYPADRRLLARFPRVIAVSNVLRRQLLAAGATAGHVAVIPNGIDVSVFRRDPARAAAIRVSLGIGPDDFVVGAIGRLEEIKRVDLLIDAMSTLAATHARARLVIAGDGSLRPSLEQRARAAGLSRCLFLGHRNDIVDLHQAFDCFVQSSDSEGLSNSLLEAMAVGTPVVATAVGGTADLVEDGVHGLLVPPGRADVLVRAIAGTMDDPDATQERTRRAALRVEREFSFHERMAKVEQIYVDLVSARHPGRIRDHGEAP